MRARTQRGRAGEREGVAAGGGGAHAQILMVLSRLPLARRPPGRAARAETELLCPSRTPPHSPVLVFHTRTVLSHDPLASRPSASTARAHTILACSSRVRSHAHSPLQSHTGAVGARSNSALVQLCVCGFMRAFVHACELVCMRAYVTCRASTVWLCLNRNGLKELLQRVILYRHKKILCRQG